MSLKRMPSGRVCVTLPLDLLEDYRERSRLTGLSVSRLIYRQLRSRKPIVIVTNNILSGLDRLHATMERLEKNGVVDTEALGVLRSYVEHVSRVVEYDSPGEVIHVRIKNSPAEGGQNVWQ